MGRGNAEMSRSFRVIQDFGQFRAGEEVKGSLYPDCFVVSGGGATMEIPYSEIQYVVHCQKPQTMMAGFANTVPFYFGGDSLVSLIAESAASIGMAGVERAAVRDFFKMLFLVGYYDGEEECWVTMEDNYNYETMPFVQELAARSRTKVTHYFAGLIRKTGEYVI